MKDLDYFHGTFPRILVTGGAGFIGGALIQKLLKSTRSKIFNLDKIGYASDLTGIERVLLELGKDNYARHNLLKVDLVDSEATLLAVKKADPDLIFHLAAESHVDRSIDGPVAFLESNVIGTVNILQAARYHWENLSKARKDTFRFHHISTDEVFGSLNDLGRFNESSPYDPRSPYSASKASSDHFVNSWHHTYGLPIVLTNCSNNYGPWQFPEKLIPVVILKAIRKEPIPLYGSGKNIRDWLHVDDHVNALLHVAIKGNPGCKYCVGGNNEFSNKDVVKKICLLLDSMRPNSQPYDTLIKFVPDRPGHDYRYAIDPGLLMRELNWSPSFDFESGLRQTVSWYLDNLEWCKLVRKNSGYSGERLGSS